MWFDCQLRRNPGVACSRFVGPRCYLVMSPTRRAFHKLFRFPSFSLDCLFGPVQSRLEPTLVKQEKIMFPFGVVSRIHTAVKHVNYLDPPSGHQFGILTAVEFYLSELYRH